MTAFASLNDAATLAVPASTPHYTLADLAKRVGHVLGTSPWITIDQARIDAFAHATCDMQWIHVDPARAAGSPFESTIAHGFLTLSLMSWFGERTFVIDGLAHSLNYGLEPRALSGAGSGGQPTARRVQADELRACRRRPRHADRVRSDDRARRFEQARMRGADAHAALSRGLTTWRRRRWRPTHDRRTVPRKLAAARHRHRTWRCAFACAWVGATMGLPLLLLHGHPQTHAIWHRTAPVLGQHFRLVLADLRGYGDSSKPQGDTDHANYSKRAMAHDMLVVMRQLGHERFAVLAHDRGARVAHRLAADHSQAVTRLVVLDIAPTLAMYEQTNEGFARAYWHWFFLIQPAPLPERLIEADPSRLPARPDGQPARRACAIRCARAGRIRTLHCPTRRRARHVRGLPRRRGHRPRA